jgi:hypothetical protein
MFHAMQALCAVQHGKNLDKTKKEITIKKGNLVIIFS